MPDPRQGRASAGGYSPRLGRRDPRLRMNASGSVTDNDHDKKTIARDSGGRARLAAFDGLPALPANATTAEIAAYVRRMVQRGQGR